MAAQSSSSRFRPQWSRLAHALLLCLACQPKRGHAANNNVKRRSLRRRQQQQNTGLAFPSPRHLVQTRIVNGDDAQGSQDFPFFAQWYRGCGATLIHNDVILTAAHCYSETLLEHKLRVEGDLQQRLLDIVDSRVHPEFNDQTNWINNNEYDFMLLKLDTPLPQIRPVQLHSEQELPPSDQENLTIVGYGLTSEDGTVAKTLQAGTVQYHEDCSFSSYRPEKVSQETMFCAHGSHNQTHAIDSCQGDSGGPILRKTPQGWMQMGVTSWGEGCARPEAPGIYARMTVAYDWIQAQLCELSSAPPPYCSSGSGGSSSIPEEDESLADQAANYMASSPQVEEEDVSSTPQLDETQSQTPELQQQPQPNRTTVLSTVTAIRVDIQYDDYPQEISWALAKEVVPDSKLSTESTFNLVHISRRQPVSVRNQLVSQEIKNLPPGSNFRLEFYDQIAGDGLAGPTDRDAIQVFQVESVIETTFELDGRSSSTVPVDIKELESTSRLVWSHSGNFGESVRANMSLL